MHHGLQQRQNLLIMLIELEDSEEMYESIEDIWPDFPTNEDFFYSDEEEEY